MADAREDTGGNAGEDASLACVLRRSIGSGRGLIGVGGDTGREQVRDEALGPLEEVGDLLEPELEPSMDHHVLSPREVTVGGEAVPVGVPVLPEHAEASLNHQVGSRPASARWRLIQLTWSHRLTPWRSSTFTRRRLISRR